MGLNTLSDSGIAEGQKLQSSHIINTNNALRGALVGRATSGAPTAGQQLGTAVVPWGVVHANGLVLNGTTVDPSLIESRGHRIVSSAVRVASLQPDFLRPAGAAGGLSATLLATVTPLELIIEGAAVTVSTDIALTSLSAAPSSNNTALVNDTSLTGQEASKYTGERDSVLTIDTAGSEITSRVGSWASFKTPTGEILFAYIKSATELVSAYRGFYFDSAGAEIRRGVLSNNDTLTLLSTGWVFVESDWGE